jgi:hypothetical protein
MAIDLPMDIPRQSLLQGTPKSNQYPLPIDMDIHLAIQIAKWGVEPIASHAGNLLARYTANATRMIERSDR